MTFIDWRQIDPDHGSSVVSHASTTESVGHDDPHEFDLRCWELLRFTYWESAVSRAQQGCHCATKCHYSIGFVFAPSISGIYLS